MKINLKISLLVLTAVLLVSTQALATGINFVGPSFSLTDADSDGFSEQLILTDAWVTLVDPVSDAIFGDAGFETIQFSPLFLDPTNYNPGVNYQFNPSTTPSGFRVFDDDGTSLFSADLITPTLDILGQTGSISPFLTLNLTNITASGSYVPGSSIIIDSFLNNPIGGDISITLQLAGINFGNGIENGQDFTGTYSGSANPVPEPATMLLLGSGLAGLAGIRRKFAKK